MYTFQPFFFKVCNIVFSQAMRNDIISNREWSTGSFSVTNSYNLADRINDHSNHFKSLRNSSSNQFNHFSEIFLPPLPESSRLIENHLNLECRYEVQQNEEDIDIIGSQEMSKNNRSFITYSAIPQETENISILPISDCLESDLACYVSSSQTSLPLPPQIFDRETTLKETIIPVAEIQSDKYDNGLLDSQINYIDTDGHYSKKYEDHNDYGNYNNKCHLDTRGLEELHPQSIRPDDTLLHNNTVVDTNTTKYNHTEKKIGYLLNPNPKNSSTFTKFSLEGSLLSTPHLSTQDPSTPTPSTGLLTASSSNPDIFITTPSIRLFMEEDAVPIKMTMSMNVKENTLDGCEGEDMRVTKEEVPNLLSLSQMI